MYNLRCLSEAIRLKIARLNFQPELVSFSAIDPPLLIGIGLSQLMEGMILISVFLAVGNSNVSG